VKTKEAANSEYFLNIFCFFIKKNSMKLLIIESEAELTAQMIKYFKRANYFGEVATTFKEGLKKLINYDYDCVLLDLNLEGGDGLDLVRSIRREDNQTAVIIISARKQVEDRIASLDAGADDFLAKPFHMGELHARIKAVMRRKTNQFSKEMDFGDIKINLEERNVYAKGKVLKLTKKEFDIIVFLARRKNRVVTKESIAEYLWGDYMEDAVTFDFIYAHVKNIRKKLVEEGCGEYLKTVYGVGYKFIAN
jgi:DNA-binding response OmpR family regulator